MLSAFREQPIHELKSRDKSKVESLLAYGDRLLVGLNTGVLRIFRVNEQANGDQPIENGVAPETSAKSKAVELLREEDKFSKKPVQQLAVVKEASLLVSLSDGFISLHDLQTYQLVERLERTKGAACFTITSNVVKDSETNVPSLVSRLAVGVRRKVLCWTWQDMEQLPDVAEVNLEASVKSLTWATGTKLVVGMDPGFVILDIQSQEAVAINKPASRTTTGENGELAGARFAAVSSSGMGYMGMASWVPRPMAARISDEDILLAKDVNTLFVDAEGTALERRQVPWSLAPEAIGYSYPYLLALQPPEKGQLQIRNPDTLSLLQTISVPQAMILHVPQPNISLAHAGKGFLVASDRTIWRMNALPYDAQLHDLMEKQRFDEAVSLLNLLEDTLIEDKAGRIREIKIQKAIALFQQQKYWPALYLFSEAEASPERVLVLYPKSMTGDLSSTPNSSKPSQAEHVTEEPERVNSNEVAKEPPTSAAKSVFGRFAGGHKRGDSDPSPMRTTNRDDSDSMSIRTKPAPKAMTKRHPEKPLEGEDLKLATIALYSFLAQARVQIQKYLGTDGTLQDNPPELDKETGKPAFANLLPQSTFSQPTRATDWQSALLKTAQLVDTTLFRAYMLANPSLVGSLFRLDNFCDPDVVRSSLYENERYGDMIDFLHGKKLHRQALEILTKFGKGKAEGVIPEGMQGPERTVAYLKQLPPELVDIVLEFALWPIQEKPDAGMEVFLADSDNAEKLPKERVLQFLASIDTRLEERYLEHVINELDDQTGSYHQQLADLYVEELKSANISDDEKPMIKEKLCSFLQKSKIYDKIKTFRQLPANESIFFEPRALVLSAMGNHKQALSIYVFQIKDYTRAEDYCNRQYVADEKHLQEYILDAATTHEKPFKQFEPEDTPNRPNIFAVLVGLYLRPPPGEEKRWPQALDLLSKHGARLPASSTLDLMPSDLAVKELQDYFRGRMRNAASILREEKIVRSLEAVRKVSAESLLLLGPDDKAGGRPQGRNRRVLIREEDHCKVCHKRFGASAVRVWPDGAVVHYGCVGKGDGGRARGVGLSGGRRATGWT